jgi:hypothetical protein
LSARKEGRRILSGQFSDFGDGANLRIMERIQKRTGRWPGLIGVDYADFGRGSLTYKTQNRVAIEDCGRAHSCCSFAENRVGPGKKDLLR